MATKKNLNVPKKMQAKYNEVVALIDFFCEAHLNEEYAQMCHVMAAKLARKRPSPLEKGDVKTWAAGITYEIGNVNYLFDMKQPPYMPATDLARLYEVSKPAPKNRAREIRGMFNIDPFDPEWTLPSLMDRNAVT